MIPVDKVHQVLAGSKTEFVQHTLNTPLSEDSESGGNKKSLLFVELNWETEGFKRLARER